MLALLSHCNFAATLDRGCWSGDAPLLVDVSFGLHYLRRSELDHSGIMIMIMIMAMRCIAVEEAFATPEIMAQWHVVLASRAAT
jgi:hypothetical protein